MVQASRMSARKNFLHALAHSRRLGDQMQIGLVRWPMRCLRQKERGGGGKMVGGVQRRVWDSILVRGLSKHTVEHWSCRVIQVKALHLRSRSHWLFRPNMRLDREETPITWSRQIKRFAFSV